MMKKTMMLGLIAGFLLFCLPVSARAEMKEWTWMVFMNADNDLDPFADEDFQEMMQAGGSTRDLNIITLTDRAQGPASLFYVEKSGPRELQKMGEVDMGDYRVLIEFVREAVKRYPARRYVLSIWNHGWGWPSKGLAAGSKGISNDDTSGNYITTAQLGQAMREIRKTLGRELDVLSMDACLMQMMEVAWEIRDTCRFVLASEELEPGNGYPYHHVLPPLNRTITTEAFLGHWVNVFRQAYNGGCYGREASTLSVIDLRQLSGVMAAINGFADRARQPGCCPALRKALAKVQRFDTGGNIDLGHLLRLLKPELDAASDLLAAINSLEAALQKLILVNATTGQECANATGLAIFFPKRAKDFDQTYLNLAFARDGGYDELLQAFFAESQAALALSAAVAEDPAAFREAVSGPFSPEVKRDLLARLRFELFSENRCPCTFQAEAVKVLFPGR